MLTTRPADRIANGFQPLQRRGRRVASLVAVLIVAGVVLGVFLRLYHIERKVYWEDETYTSLHVLGVTEADVVRRSSAYVDAAALRTVLHPLTSKTTVADTIRSLAVEDSQHPPLYYIAGHVWIGFFGDSVGAIRLLSAFIGIAALPCMYWLCIELFASGAAAWIGVALFSLSPVAVLFSQEAREYILWSAAVIVVSAAFLRALRLMSAAAWTWYAVAVTAALYVYPVTAAIAAGNLILAALVKRREPRALTAPFLATVAAGAAFAPWLAVMFGASRKIAHAMGVSSGLRPPNLHAINEFIGLVKLNFLDLDGMIRHGLLVLVSFAAVSLTAYAFVHLIARAPRQTSGFIVMLAITSAAPFVVPDVLLGQQFTANARYFMAFFLATDLALVYLFASKLRPTSLRRSERRAWALTLAVVLSARAASCLVSANADTWWTKYGERSIDIAHAINATDHPLIVSTDYMERALSLSNYLDAKVALQLRPRCYLCTNDAPPRFDLSELDAQAQYSDVFVLGSPARVQADVRAALGPARTSVARCIDDQLDEQNACADDRLALWPT